MNTTLLLTNRFKPIILALGLSCGLTGFIIIGSATCNHQQDIPDVAYKARALGGFQKKNDKVVAYRLDGKDVYFGDTTKPKPKVIYNHYKLEGSDTLFQQLWLQVQSPIDVTPRNLQLLKNWLQTSIKIDSTNGK